MENKINIAELLKDCPKGMELDCTMYENVYFDKTYNEEDCLYPIGCYMIGDNNRNSVNFTKYGEFNYHSNAKCVIFPKSKTTWEGFTPPCKFKDGDAVVAEDSESFQLFLLKHLTHSEDDNDHNGYCYFGWDFQFNSLFEKGNWGFNRLATEEEKQKLFNAIKANGYKWNPETKTLEKLIEPKFKVGDRVRNKNYKDYIYTIHDIVDKGYSAKEIDADYPIIILFGSQEDNYELVPNKFDITTLVPFESKVLVRDINSSYWIGAFYSHYNSKKFYTIGGSRYYQCIPYEGNEHLLDTTNDCDDFYKTWEL